MLKVNNCGSMTGGWIVAPLSKLTRLTELDIGETCHALRGHSLSTVKHLKATNKIAQCLSFRSADSSLDVYSMTQR